MVECWEQRLDEMYFFLPDAHKNQPQDEEEIEDFHWLAMTNLVCGILKFQLHTEQNLRFKFAHNEKKLWATTLNAEWREEKNKSNSNSPRSLRARSSNEKSLREATTQLATSLARQSIFSFVSHSVSINWTKENLVISVAHV